ncbi:MAG TPA: FG-GAP-like repeat-containing protein, partial [Planctomycetaceae bacterium]|nr:FG-GAP-like repeat-containing protein [Planctomycetaceae bacterium]
MRGIALLLVLAPVSCKPDPNPGLKKPGSAELETAARSGTDSQNAEATGEKSNFKAPPVLFDAPKFNLTDQSGAQFGTNDLAGRVWVANFMFTHCMATCPRQTARLEELQKHARGWPDWNRLRIVSITVDPDRDTVSRLKEYAGEHHAEETNWKFLTGSRQELFEISKKGFKLPAAESAADASSPITHSARLILVDSQMRVRGLYDAMADDEFLKLRADLRAVLSESTPDGKELVYVGQPAEAFDPPWLEPRRAAQLATAGEIDAFHDFTFVDEIEHSGIRFVSRVVADSARDFKLNHYDHGNGIVVADVDGDGLYDLYFVNQVGGNELWRNLGQGRFENITDKAGVALAGRVSVTASFADTDNDGDPDLFVTTTRHGNAFFENDGHGNFRDMTEPSGLGYVGHSSSADFFDYDRDGRLDLFVSNVGVFTSDEIGYNGDPESRKYPYYIGLKDAIAGHLFPERSERSILYRNEGANRFRDVSEETGLVHTGWSGDATPLDANEDGWIDLYVLNMQGNDDYYENVGGKRFERKSRDVFSHTPWGAMGIKSFDYNNDGRMDLFITNMHADMWNNWPSGPQEKLKASAGSMPESFLLSPNPEMNVFGNAFYENQGGGKFVEVSDRINAENYWPWGLSVGDFNADGFQDAFITSSMNLTFRYQVNSLFLNEGGKKFRDAEFIVGVEPRHSGKTATPWFPLDCSGRDAGHKICEGRKGRVEVWAPLGSRSSVIFDLDQ